MITELITANITSPTLAITEEAINQRDELVIRLAGIGAVTDAATQASAVEIGVEARKFVKAVETQRKSTTEPFREFTSKINSLAKELSEPVEAQMKRAGEQVAKYQQIEAARVEKERRERYEAEQAAMRAKFEADRLAEATEAEITNETDLAAAIKAEEEAKAKEKLMYATLTAPLPAANKAAGSATTNKMMYEVTDIKALYAARPDLCRVEPNAAAIRALVTADMTNIPGLRVWSEMATSFRVR